MTCHCSGLLRRLLLPTVGVAFLTSVVAVAAAQNTPKRESSPASGQQAAQVADQLQKLALRCDADGNRILAPEEHAKLLEHVEKEFGAAWAARTAEFLTQADADGNRAIDAAEWTAAIAKLRKQPTADPPPKQALMVPMSDGVRLATDVYLPPGDGSFPVVLTRTPYDRQKNGPAAARQWNAAGIAFMVQNARGRFGSEGENLPFIGCGWTLHRDGADAIAWIREQPWCNGKVGTEGGSANGTTQNLLAAAGAQGVTAQYISVAPPCQYGYAAYIGGALRKCQVENWLTSNKFDDRALEITRLHPNDDDYWRASDTRTKFALMNAPAVHVGGWFDTFAQGTIDSFLGRQHQGAEGARGKQKLVMGPWDHGGWRHAEVGDLSFPNNGAPKQYDASRWFAYHLLGAKNGVMEEPAVAYYVMGDTQDPKAPGNVWRQAADWPVPAKETRYYFTQEQGLTTQKPVAANAAREFTFDPGKPCPTIGGGNLTIPRGPRNQNPIESRPDVLLFSTPPLAAPVEVTGRVRARIFVSSSARDTDLSVRLCDVYPDGKSYLMAEGILRLRFRKSFAAPEPLTPGEVAAVDVDCWSTSIVFNRGHRIRVTVTSSNTPRFDVNPGTGLPWSDDGQKVVQRNTIYCDAGRPSCVVLPVVDEAALKKADAQAEGKPLATVTP